MVVLFITILVMALLQVVGIASILPFMQLVSDPDILSQHEILRSIQDFFGIESVQSMLIVTGFGVLFLLTVGNLFSAFTVWLQYKFAWEVAHNISTRLLNSYLKKPFEYFLNVESSVLINKTVVEVARFSREVLIQVIEFAARTAVVSVITGLLIWVDPKLAIYAIVTFGLAYLSIYAITKNYLKRKGNERTKENEKSLKSINDAFNGIKTVKIYSAEPLFYRRFERASLRLISMYPKINLISTAPRYLIETLAFGGILGVILLFLITGKDLQHILPILSLYALAGYRLLPSLQKAFAAASSARHSFSIVDNIYQDLQQATLHSGDPQKVVHQAEMPLFSKRILFQEVGFNYGEKVVFDDLNLSIEKGDTVGLVGPIGSGKSTLINLLAGLISPQQGSIEIDDTVLDEKNIESWKTQIGYVPQEVFLFDDTIYRNIAMGIEDGAIDMARVERSAQLACIHDFIVNELPSGYHSKVGERGARLSGGQRQLIGLARAIYRNPKLLILDESTNSLDNITETTIIESLSNLAEDLTTIIIAHRLTSVQHVDRILILQDGKIVDEGSYATLLEKNQTFRELARIS